MRRADLIRLSGVSVRTFDALTRRGQLPFGRGQDRAWRMFTTKEAWQFVLMLALAREGVTLGDASLLMRLHYDEWCARIGDPTTRSRAGAPSIFVGWVSIGAEGSDGEAGVRSREPIAGPWRNLAAQIDDHAASYANEGVLGAVLVDASRRLQTLRDEAALLGLPVDEFTHAHLWAGDQ